MIRVFPAAGAAGTTHGAAHAEPRVPQFVSAADYTSAGGGRRILGYETPRTASATHGGLVSPRVHDAFMRGWMQEVDRVDDQHTEQLLARWKETNANMTTPSPRRTPRPPLYAPTGPAGRSERWPCPHEASSAIPEDSARAWGSRVESTIMSQHSSASGLPRNDDADDLRLSGATVQEESRSKARGALVWGGQQATRHADRRVGFLPLNFKLPSTNDIVSKGAAKSGQHGVITRASGNTLPLDGNGSSLVESVKSCTSPYESPAAGGVGRGHSPMSARGTSWSQMQNTRKTWDGAELIPVRLSTPRLSAREFPPLTPRDREVSRCRWEVTKILQAHLRRTLCVGLLTAMKEEAADTDSKERVAPHLQACLRRTGESIRIWCAALSDVESAIVQKDVLQKNAAAIKQMTTLQNATAWADLRRQTEEDLASVLQETRSKEEYCRELPVASRAFAGAEFERRVAAAAAITAFMRRIAALHKQRKVYRRWRNQIEPKLVVVPSSFYEPAQAASLKKASPPLSSGPVPSTSGLSSRHGSFGREWSESYSSGYIPENHDLGRENVDSNSQSGFGGELWRQLVADSQGVYAYSPMSSGESVGTSSVAVGSSVDATIQNVLRASSDEDIDLRQVFGREYIQELSVNLDPACNGKVTVESRDMQGNTALHLAAWRGDRLACHWLISNGADISTLNNDGRSALDFAVHSESFHCMEVLLGAQAQGRGEAAWTLSLPRQRQTDIDISSLRATYGLEGEIPKAVSSSTPSELRDFLKDRLDLAENGRHATPLSPQTMLSPLLVHSSLDSRVPVSWDPHAWSSAGTAWNSSERSVAMTKAATSTPTVASPALSSASSGDDRRAETGAKWNEAFKGFVTAVKTGSTCDVNGITAASQLREKETRGNLDLPMSPGQSTFSFSGSAPSTPQTPLSIEVASRHSLFRNWPLYEAANGSPWALSGSPSSVGNADRQHADPRGFDSPLQGRNALVHTSRPPARRRHEFVIDC